MLAQNNFFYNLRNVISGQACSGKILIMGQFSLRKNRKRMQQMEISNDN